MQLHQTNDSGNSIWQNIAHVPANNVRPPLTTMTTHGSPIAPLAQNYAISLSHVIYVSMTVLLRNPQGLYVDWE